MQGWHDYFFFSPLPWTIYQFYSIPQNDNDVAAQAVIWILQCQWDIFHTVETSAKINSYENYFEIFFFCFNFIF